MLRLAVALSSIFAAAPPAKAKLECGEMTCALFARPGDAFERVLAEKPRVLAIGEVHQTVGTVAVQSAISRFTKQMLPRLKHRASDLIAETWITEGSCGEEETQAVEAIEETTQRPVETEDEVVTLLKKTRALGTLPHILQLSCEQYRPLLTKEGELDAERVLKLVTELMLEKARMLAEKNEARGSKRMVVIYGGAVHNDLRPAEDLKEFSFGPQLDAAADGRYVALDLFVPELIAGDEDWSKEPWYPYFEKYASPTKTLLIRTDESSFALIFPRRR